MSKRRRNRHPKQPTKRFFTRHPKDLGVDEILICSPVADKVVPETVAEARDHAFLKIAPVERYKTSGLSGDEWRFSAALYLRETHRADWRMISTYGSLDAAPAFLYPELYGDFQSGKWTMDDLIGRKVGAITFAWKGLPIWSTSYEGKQSDLLVAAAHLPIAWLQAGDQGCDPEPLQRLCCQPGCVQPWVSIYRILKNYCNHGRPHDHGTGWDHVRGFCARHLRRGDCGLDDADANYVVVEGPGPKGHEPDPSVVKQAKMASPIILDNEDDAMGLA